MALKCKTKKNPKKPKTAMTQICSIMGRNNQSTGFRWGVGENIFEKGTEMRGPRGRKDRGRTFLDAHVTLYGTWRAWVQGPAENMAAGGTEAVGTKQ